MEDISTSPLRGSVYLPLATDTEVNNFLVYTKTVR